MAFITNQNKNGSTTLAKRLAELIGHTDQLDMLVGFFYFSGVKVLAEALRDRRQMKMRVLVGMDAEFALGQLVEVVQKGGVDSCEAIEERFLESMKKIMGSSFFDSQAFHKRVGIFIDLLETKRLDIRKTRDPNHAKLYIFTMDETQVGNRKYWITGSSNFSEPGLKLRDELNVQIGDFGKEMAKSAKENFDASFEVQTDEYDILLTTDKLSEGFNLNRAGLVVNYDIPWNPTRVIQRVGRINRIGRKVFDNLYIFNFFPTVKGASIVANRAIAEHCYPAYGIAMKIDNEYLINWMLSLLSWSAIYVLRHEKHIWSPLGVVHRSVCRLHSRLWTSSFPAPSQYRLFLFYASGPGCKIYAG